MHAINQVYLKSISGHAIGKCESLLHKMFYPYRKQELGYRKQIMRQLHKH